MAAHGAADFLGIAVEGLKMAQAEELPTDWEYWERNCKAFISVSKKMVILMLPGWDTSTGVNAEFAIAKELDIPVEFEQWFPWTYEPNQFRLAINSFESRIGPSLES
jgi:hypothetical protein